MKILYLAHRIPYPPNKGDKIRSFNEIKHLSQRHEIHLACMADNPADLKYANDLKKYCTRVHVERLVPSRAKTRGALFILRGRSFSVGYFYSKILQRVADEWTQSTHYDAIICFSSPMAEYIFRCSNLKHPFSHIHGPRTLHPAPCLIMDFVDVDSDKWRQYANKSVFPASLIYWLESWLLIKYEKKINRYFDYSIFVSQPEAVLFSKLYPEAGNIKVISNGVDHEYFSPDCEKATSVTVHHAPCTSNPVILFTGAMDYHANIDGVMWFCNEIFPLIRRESPSVEFHVVGSNPAPDVKRLANRAGVKVTGFVEDIRTYYRAADVCVAPLRLARGVQNKVLEAMAMRKPVVATTKALEGIEATPLEVLMSDDADGIAKAVGALLKNEEKRKFMGENARQFVVNHIDWSANMKVLEALMHQG